MTLYDANWLPKFEEKRIFFWDKGLSSHPFNALMRSELSLAEILEAIRIGDDEKLLSLRNFGRVSLQELKNALAYMNEDYAI